MDSILTSIKKMLGIPEEYEQFDMDLIIHINSVLGILTQIGVGPSEGYFITSKTNTWNELLLTSSQFEMVKSYIYLKVRLLFDPPTSSAAVESAKQLISELEWRLSVAVHQGEGGEEETVNE